MIRRHRLGADQRLGQHFLLDPQILARIAAAAGNLRGATVLEVGPGPGGLTRALLGAGVRRVIAIERDRRCVAALAELVEAAEGRLELIEADALEVTLADLTPGRLAVVANLPYNVATALLVGWLGQLDRIEAMTLMFQEEVARRLIAEPGSPAYGRLSVLVRWLCEARMAMRLPPRAFTPAPKVASALVHLVPRPAPLAPADRAALERVLAAAFGQRRKMLRSSLKSLGGDAASLLAEAAVPATARAEEIDVAGFCRLARAYAGRVAPSTITPERGTDRRSRQGPAGDAA